MRLFLILLLMPLLAAHDALLSPTAPSPAPEGLATGDPWFCAPWSFAGAPAISLPMARQENGLPFGIHAQAKQADDGLLLQLAALIQRQVDHTRYMVSPAGQPLAHPGAKKNGKLITASATRATHARRNSRPRFAGGRSRIRSPNPFRVMSRS